ncbi:MAG TPA: DUF6537 domain-containing protein, partial [Solirubrobacteraceae bacterium]|nr:DUF6537 domain-containing protein [Solirubrobacteraceae bacterium]
VEHRDRLAEVQAELAQVEGVTVLIHVQGCAAEKRRLRKRGKIADPVTRIHINERVCEGCGDCGDKSSCLSVLPIETEFGRKTQIHQASCNKDYSCVKGDCPSFLTVIPGEKAKKVVITSDEPEKYAGVEIDPIARVEHRDRLAEAQAELAAVEGVTVLIHDQGCAAEKRRLRKRGKIADPVQRIHINERVCEGCGDCGAKSSCLSVLPVETEFGRKTQIHQASCNKDYSCVKGDCPSFLTVIPGEKAKKVAPEPPAELPEPALRVSHSDFLVRMAGVGGTGVVTVSQILQMSALLDGKHAFGLDQTGLAQKGGPVTSDVRISRDRIEGSNKAGAGAADVILGFDVLGAANPKNLLVATPEKTVAIVNTAAVPTAKMVKSTAVSFPAERRNVAAIERGTRADDNVYFDAQALAEGLFGDHMPTNLLLLGAAYQHGCLPVSADAIEQAIRLNGAAVEKSLSAFRWGRASIAQPELVHDVLNPVEPEPVVDGRALEILEGTGATGELRRLLAVRIPDLVAYKSAKYARSYADAVMAVARAEAERGAPGETAVAEAYARGLYKLMSYKDEYEVARLHLDSVERAKVTKEFGEGAKVYFMLHPPLLRALGLKRKLKLGPWFTPGFRMLRRMKRLRGTPVDVFGYAKVRRVERALIGEYRELVDRSLSELRPETHTTVAKIAALPDVVRGYEEIKLRNVERYRAEVEKLERELREGPKTPAKPRFELPVVQG